MINYIIRRFAYALPILLGVHILTFLLFFVVNSPDDIARTHLGSKHVDQLAIDNWKKQHGYADPLFYNHKVMGIQRVTNTLFFTKTIRLFLFDFGTSDAGRDISQDILQRMFPSLALAIPALVLGLLSNITFAMLMVFFSSSYIELGGIILCVILMSISALFYIISGQFIFAKLLRWVPVSGYADGWAACKFTLLPILIGLVGGLGAGTKWYRSIFLEEYTKDYVRTAKAKGLSASCVLYKHVLGNALIPILTGVVVIIPTLFMGSLLMESFFAIPGLGSYTIDAISQQDFAIVRAMVFLGSLLYLVGLLLTDLSYALVDPRVRLS